MKEIFISFHKRSSLFHKLDPISKLVWVICIMVLSLTINDFLPQLILAFIVFFCVKILAQVPFSEMGIIVWFFVMYSFLFFCMQVFLTKGDDVVLNIGSVTITREALNHAGNIAMRILVFIGMALAFIDSTNPYDLGLALHQKMKVSYTFILMFFIALLFIPLFEKEIRDLRYAYALRNINDKPRFTERISMLKFFVSSLLVRSAKRVMMMSWAIESRAFRSHENRSYLNIISISKEGFFFIAIIIILTILWMIYLFVGPT